VARVHLKLETSILVVIDVQEKLLPAVWEAERVQRQIEFITRAARILGVPVLGTEQNPGKMGSTPSSVRDQFSDPAVAKMTFSAWADGSFRAALGDSGRNQVVLCGLETHICIGLTAFDLLDEGFDVVVCPDAVSARNVERHKLGMERIRDAGAVPAHTESVVYEWLGSAENPSFRTILGLVKEYA
jgi:nicotinamidase-related amidase